MKAVVLNNTCRAEDLVVSDIPLPQVKPGWVLVHVKAFGINRSEIMVRSVEAGSPHIKLPRIIGIECAGEITDSSDSSFVVGDRVVSLMGGMGRSFDGSYAEYALLPAHHVFHADLDLDWYELGAIPETFFTAWGSLFETLCLTPADRLLVRGGTSALGIAAIQLAKSLGCEIFATTRSPEKFDFLNSIGVDHSLLEDNNLRNHVLELTPDGMNKVLELVGPASLPESLRMTAHHGIVCVTGLLGGQHVLDGFDPIKFIPNGVYLSSFFSNFPTKETMKAIFNHIRKHKIRPQIARVFRLQEISQAHIFMESNSANGKIVVTT